MPSSFLEIVTPFKRYPPVGRCIYCRRWHGVLEKEHIIPFGLAEDSLVLPKSSCRKCAEKTRTFEQACLRHMWWPFRTHIGAPSRKGERPNEFELKRIEVTSYDSQTKAMTYDKGVVSQVPADEYPLFYYAFTFRRPGLLSGIRSTSIEHGDFCLVDHEELRRLISEDKKGFRLGPGNWMQFCQMLAKIAHSYATAELGYKSFFPYLNSYIRGSAINVFDFVGSETTISPKSATLHEIRLSIEQRADVALVVVTLRLFAFLGTPTYEIVVGQLNSGLDQFAILTKPLHTIDIKPPFPATNLTPLVAGARTTGG